MITASQWRRALESVLGDTNEWRFKGKLAYRVPVQWTLRGIHGEGSRRRDAVYISFIYMPLFMPTDHLIIGFGERVPNGSSRFALDDAGFEDAVRMALAGVPDEGDALEAIARSDTEEAPYALLLLDRAGEAERLLDRPFYPDDDRAFVREERERRATILKLLSDGGPEAARDQLANWRDASCAALGVG